MSYLQGLLLFTETSQGFEASPEYTLISAQEQPVSVLQSRIVMVTGFQSDALFEAYGFNHQKAPAGGVGSPWKTLCDRAQTFLSRSSLGGYAFVSSIRTSRNPFRGVELCKTEGAPLNQPNMSSGHRRN